MERPHTEVMPSRALKPITLRNSALGPQSPGMNAQPNPEFRAPLSVDVSQADHQSYNVRYTTRTAI